MIGNRAVGRVVARIAHPAVVLATLACSPAAPPLAGIPAPVRIPASVLAEGHRQILFDFSYHDTDFTLKGEGVARVASPDSARLDFFIRNESVGNAVVFGDSLAFARPAVARQLLPPPPLLWAALGVYRVPGAPDTLARVDGDTLRVEIGSHPAWRGTFVGRELLRLDLIDDGRIPQFVAREPGDRVHYHSARAKRTLDLTMRRTDTLPAFDASIWK